MSRYHTPQILFRLVSDNELSSVAESLQGTWRQVWSNCTTLKRLGGVGEGGTKLFTGFKNKQSLLPGHVQKSQRHFILSAQWFCLQVGKALNFKVPQLDRLATLVLNNNNIICEWHSDKWNAPMKTYFPPQIWKRNGKQRQNSSRQDAVQVTFAKQQKYKPLINTNTRKTQRQNFCNPTTEKPRWVQWRDQRATIGRLARSHCGKW